MMKSSKPGRRHPLLSYQRTMGRLSLATLPLGLILLAIWWWAGTYFITLDFPYDYLILISAIVVLAFSLFAILARGMAYVQAYPDHLRVVTPFLRLKISYRRVISLRTTRFAELFPPQKMGWGERRFFGPFYPQTVTVVELSQYPLSRASLRMFLPAQTLSPQSKGLVILVQDWMAFSTEIDSLYGSWKQFAGQPAPGKRGMLGSLRKK